jgi:hypothetical protein
MPLSQFLTFDLASFTEQSPIYQAKQFLEAYTTFIGGNHGRIMLDLTKF